MSNANKNKQLLDCVNNKGLFDFEKVTLLDSYKDKVFVTNLKTKGNIVEYLGTVIYNREHVNRIDNIHSKYVIFTDSSIVNELKKCTKGSDVPYTKKKKLENSTVPILKEYGISRATVFLPLTSIYNNIQHRYVDTSQQKFISQYTNLVEMAVNLGLDSYLSNHEYNRSLLMTLIVKTLHVISKLRESNIINYMYVELDDILNVKKRNGKFYVTNEKIVPVDMNSYGTKLKPFDSCRHPYMFISDSSIQLAIDCNLGIKALQKVEVNLNSISLGLH